MGDVEGVLINANTEMSAGSCRPRGVKLCYVCCETRRPAIEYIYLHLHSNASVLDAFVPYCAIPVLIHDPEIPNTSLRHTTT